MFYSGSHLLISTLQRIQFYLAIGEGEYNKIGWSAVINNYRLFTMMMLISMKESVVRSEKVSIAVFLLLNEHNKYPVGLSCERRV